MSHLPSPSADRLRAESARGLPPRSGSAPAQLPPRFRGHRAAAPTDRRAAQAARLGHRQALLALLPCRAWFVPTIPRMRTDPDHIASPSQRRSNTLEARKHDNTCCLRTLADLASHRSIDDDGSRPRLLLMPQAHPTPRERRIRRPTMRSTMRCNCSPHCFAHESKSHDTCACSLQVDEGMYLLCAAPLC
ncbi:hypothetical protein D3C85_1133360 [compost metagenome]